MLTQIAIMRPDPHSNAMQDIFARLLEPDNVNGYIHGLMSGLDTHYDLGSERNMVGRLAGNRLVVEAGIQSSLFAKMVPGDGIMLDASSDGRATSLAAGFTHVRCFTAD